MEKKVIVFLCEEMDQCDAYVKLLMRKGIVSKNCKFKRNAKYMQRVLSGVCGCVCVLNETLIFIAVFHAVFARGSNFWCNQGSMYT